MRTKFPVVVRILSILLGLGLFSGTIAVTAFSFKKFETPNLVVFIVLSGIFLVFSILIPLVVGKKVLVGLLIFSILTLGTSASITALKEPIEEALYETEKILSDETYTEKREDYVSDPTTASLTPAQAKQRIDKIWNNVKTEKNIKVYDRSGKIKYNENRRTELYGYNGSLYDDTVKAKKLIPDPLKKVTKMSIYDTVNDSLPFHPSDNESYWANGELGFVVKYNSKGSVGNSNYSHDRYKYFNEWGLIVREEYRIFVYPDENSTEIFDYQEVYKYELQIYSK